MDDLELTRKCAEMMGLKYHTDEDPDVWHGAICTYNAGSNMWTDSYNPLINDAQCFALVKKFQLTIYWIPDAEGGWSVRNEYGKEYADNVDLNRAVCECVAQMRKPA